MTVKKNSLLLTVAAAALIVCFGAGSAQALTVEQTITLGVDNNISDNDAETWLDNNQNGVLDNGDVLTGIVDWDNISPSGESYGAGANSEFSGVFSVMVTNVVDLGVGISGFEFGPDPSFATTYNLDVGAMVALWDDPTPDLDRLVDGLGTPDATDGTLVWVWGFEGDPDEQWNAIGADVPSGAAPSTPVATYAFQLSSLYTTLFPALGQVATGCSGAVYTPGPFPMPCIGVGGDSLIDINGGGSVVGAEVGSVWPIYTNSDATFRPIEAVPEPGTLALVGAGLLGLGWLRRRRARS